MKKKPFYLRLCAGLLAVSMLTGCSTESIVSALNEYLPPVTKNETISPDSKWINSSIDGSIDENTPVNQKDDFYTAVNKDWLLEPLPKDTDDISQFSPIADQYTENSYQLMKLDADDVSNLDTNVMSEEALLHIQSLIHTLVDMGADSETRNAMGAEPLRPYIEKIASISSLDEMTDYFCNTDGTNLFQTQLATFLVTTPANVEDTDNQYTVLLYPTANFSLSSSDQYDDISSNGIHCNDYNQEYLQNVLGQLGYSSHEITRLLRSCYRFETKLAHCLPDPYELRDEDYLENHNYIYTAEELSDLAGNYPLLKILNAYGLDGSNTYTVPYKIQLQRISRLYKKQNLEDMKAYLIVQTALNSADLLDDTTYEKHKELTDFLNNVPSAEEQNPTDHADFPELSDLYARYVIPYLYDAYQQMYIAHFCNSKEKQQISEMTDQLVAAFRTCIDQADWMSDETRAEAYAKLDAMGLHILYPDTLIDYSSLSFDSCNNLLDVVAAINRFNSGLDADKVNQTVNNDNWDLVNLTTLMVNAFYNPMDNSINICAALLASDNIYDENAPIEQNLARLGLVVGHEITHGFDTTGYQYDKNGRHHSWWSQADRLAFDLRANDLIKYYSGLSPVSRGSYLEGTKVSGEAIADMGGMKCILHVASQTPDFDYDAFFKSYAELWREHVTYLYATMASSDEHPAGMLRTNVTLMQFDEFQKTYDIQPGDGMYLDANDRILVW